MNDANVASGAALAVFTSLTGDATLTFDGSAETDGSLQVYAGPGNDTLTGGGNDDILGGYGGDDVLRAGGGNDYLSGGPGTNVLDGGDGFDRVSFYDPFGIFRTASPRRCCCRARRRTRDIASTR